MKWQSPSDRTQLWLFLPIILPIAALCLPFVPLILLGAKLNDWLFPQRDWHRWFAWRPVYIVDWGALKGEWFWLETVERARHWPGGECSYRLADSEKSDD